MALGGGIKSKLTKSCAKIIIFAALTGFVFFTFIFETALAGKPVITGQTQVIAKVGKREITVSEVRQEIIRLGLDPTSKEAERQALNVIIERALFVADAKRNKVDKRPEAMWRMETARDQALAEVYASIISQPPEPNHAEIEAYMAENPSLFGEARRYNFQVIELEMAKIDLDQATKLFDETKDFSAFIKWLNDNNIGYTLSPALRDGASFPDPIRVQLAQYGPGDNVVLAGDKLVTIMKIITVEETPLSYKEGAPLARVILRRKKSQQRLQNKIEKLRAQVNITYYRKELKANAPSQQSGGAQ
jgi:EpsD family peptidyl-prolyl cis-trans isomerase